MKRIASGQLGDGTVNRTARKEIKNGSSKHKTQTKRRDYWLRLFFWLFRQNGDFVELTVKPPFCAGDFFCVWVNCIK